MNMIFTTCIAPNLALQIRRQTPFHDLLQQDQHQVVLFLLLQREKIICLIEGRGYIRENKLDKHQIAKCLHRTKDAPHFYLQIIRSTA